MAGRDTIIVSEEQGIATVTLNAPDRLNALTPADFGALRDSIAKLHESKATRVVVLTGAGRAFCAGGDFRSSQGVVPLADMSGYEFIRTYEAAIKPVIAGLMGLSVPTIAMINGPAYGSGFDLALACDIRLASTTAVFSVAWLTRALVPATGTTWLLPRIIGFGRATEITLSGREVNADEAQRIGLVSRVIESDVLGQETQRYAHTLASGAPIALALTKKSLYAGTTLSLDAALESLAAYQVIAFSSADFREGTAAFRERREPHFTGG